jgi:hypothetical protein
VAGAGSPLAGDAGVGVGSATIGAMAGWVSHGRHNAVAATTPTSRISSSQDLRTTCLYA